MLLAVRRSATSGLRCAMHYMLNPLIELDGDRARGKVSGLFAFTSDSNPKPIWLSNIYTDEYVRTPKGWRFQSVRIQMTFADPAFLEGYADHLQS